MEFFTWQMLLTAAGAAAATLGLTHFLKDWIKIPTQFLAWIIAYIVLLLANVFSGSFTVSVAVLSIFNAWLISSGVSNGVAAVNRSKT